MGSNATVVDPIEETWTKTDEQFISEYLKPSNDHDWRQWVHSKTQEECTITLAQAANMSLQDLKSCLALIEESSKAHYEASSGGWNPRKKLTEMKEPEMRYIVVKNAAGDIRGFTSLMPTYEEREPVIYCYEIHLKPEMRGTGLGRHLMGFQESVAKHIQTVEKVMLTCFVKNTDAFEFYKRLGFGIDPISPEPRQLRHGKELAPNYVIMSKKVK
ncbi:acyl-CoA N-acyltransferase [Truncatella angustata]|uniref:N-alpha-acetyltransferase 40 n=1 Tax=Truncatella angustata TaxID=152316 RepID=A0A9P8UTA2_9PEZI|nr:acyl-CoA N-acyltransferase [Truncatella angustata]KAH6657911.1 acyl-CoA N-acyltransferase [Truncatella angustata]KAH8197750.1 hypothetical protein TruAng_008084 [Truncatella angustata]